MSETSKLFGEAKTSPQALLAMARDRGCLPPPEADEPFQKLESLCGHPDCVNGSVYDRRDRLAPPTRCPGCVARERLERLAREFGRSALPASMLATTWDDVDLSHESWRKLRRLALRIGDVRARGYNAILAGLPGRGKSLGATLVLRTAIEAGYSARMLTAAQVTQMALKTYRRDSTESLEDLMIRLSAPDFLAIDDLGAAETQSRATEVAVFTQLIDQRVKEKKPTIITANLDAAEDFEKALGFRAFERIRYKCAPIAFDGPNYRQAADEAEVDDLDRFIFGDEQAAD